MFLNYQVTILQNLMLKNGLRAYNVSVYKKRQRQLLMSLKYGLIFLGLDVI